MPLRMIKTAFTDVLILKKFLEFISDSVTEVNRLHRQCQKESNTSQLYATQEVLSRRELYLSLLSTEGEYR
jgi:hypothetical protein